MVLSKKLIHTDEDSIYLSCLMKHELIYFRAIGMIHLKEDHIAVKVYNVVMMVLAWANFIKSFTALDLGAAFDKVMVIKIVSILWLGVNAINISIFYYISEKEDRLNLMIKKIDRLLKRQDPNAKCRKRIRVAIFVLTLISAMILVTNLACLTVSFFGPPSFIQLFGIMLTPANPDDPVGSNAAYRLLNEALTMVTTFAWGSHVIFYLSNLVILKQILLNYNEKFVEFISASEINSSEMIDCKDSCFGGPRLVSEDEFEYYLNWNLEITSLLDTANECFKHFLGLVLVSYGPITFLLLFIMSNWSGNDITGILAVVYPFWLIVATSILCSTLYFASKINTLVS